MYRAICCDLITVNKNEADYVERRNNIMRYKVTLLRKWQFFQYGMTSRHAQIQSINNITV